MKLPDPSLRARLAHVLWLGGGSGAGKSSIGRRLAQAHGLALYSTDGAIAGHVRRLPVEEAPLLAAFLAQSMDQRWVERTPEAMLESFPWFAGEGFGLIVEDLLAMPADRPVIVEGFRVLPRRVAPLLRARSQAMWLLPTPAFRRAAFEARGGLWDIAGKTSDPGRALGNLLARDGLFTQRLEREVAELGLAAAWVDGAMDEAAVSRAVAEGFGLG